MSEASGRGLAGGGLFTLANAITLVRLALAPVHALLILAGSWHAAFACFWLAVLTDLVDGRVARARGEASSLGGLLDHSSDALFVSLGLAAVSFEIGGVPAVLPMLVALAFLQYTLDSKALAGQPLRTSVIGRHNGIAYFVLLGVPVVRDGLGIGWPPNAWIAVMGWGLVVSTLASMVDRAVAYLALRRGGA